jgi:hypothetical protein
MGHGALGLGDAAGLAPATPGAAGDEEAGAPGGTFAAGEVAVEGGGLETAAPCGAGEVTGDAAGAVAGELAGAGEAACDGGGLAFAAFAAASAGGGLETAAP